MSEEFNDLFDEIGKTIYCYLSREVSQDPEEDDKKIITYNPVPIKAIVNDLTSSQIQWKLGGTGITQGKDLLIEKKWRNTIEQSYKISIDGVEYISWKDNNSKVQIRECGDYIRLYIYRK